MAFLINTVDKIISKHPPFYYWVRTLLFSVLCKPRHTFVPPLRQDFERYKVLFDQSSQNFEDIVEPYLDEMKWPLGRVYNGNFESIDCDLYYSIIRKFKPEIIIEIGTGNSALFALEAMKRNKKGRILTIDPEPRIKLPKGIKQIKLKVEEVPLSLFYELGENDILFIDSSHTTVEASYHVKHVFPILKSGVLIHHHDILFPYDIYFGDDKQRFAEQDVLLDFYLANKDIYQIITSAAFVCHLEFEKVKKIIKTFEHNLFRRPGSLWTKKVKSGAQVKM